MKFARISLSSKLVCKNSFSSAAAEQRVAAVLLWREQNLSNLGFLTFYILLLSFFINDKLK